VVLGVVSLTDLCSETKASSISVKGTPVLTQQNVISMNLLICNLVSNISSFKHRSIIEAKRVINFGVRTSSGGLGRSSSTPGTASGKKF
jgi:hypothetical protein